MKIDRLIGILSILLQKETITAPVLAEQFEVSRRTISRDIDTLCQAGIPIVTRQGINGGISMIRLPEFVTREVFDWAVREATEKKKTDFSGCRMHHEIYLSDPRRTAPEKLRTVIRLPIRRK